jgi:CheY-like chemotaxis protein
MGYLCDVAENGRQALSLITNHYDLMLIDASLPDINGVMLTKIIREELNHDPTKIIVFIRYEEIKRLCFHVGANAVIQKPIEENIFKDTMLKWLKH